MLVEELKPFIDSQYRTLTDPANTGLGGVSLGGIVSLHLGLEYPMVFGKLAVMSPSVWWDNKIIVRNVKDLKTKPALRIWLDIGTGEGPRAVDDAKELRNAFVKKGWVLNSDLIYFEAKGSGHNEQAFAQRAEPMLKYLFQNRRIAGIGENPVASLKNWEDCPLCEATLDGGRSIRAAVVEGPESHTTLEPR